MRRRDLIALIAAMAAAPATAFADDAAKPIDKAFPFLAAYLALPPAQRSRFYLAYRAYRDKRPASGIQGVIVSPGGEHTPVVFDHTGEVTHLPSLAELKSGATFQPLGAPFMLGPEMRTTAAPAIHVAPAELVATLAQVNTAVQKIAGAFSMMAPKFTAALFPDSGQGQVMLDGGHSTPLPIFASPVVGPIPYFEPGASPAARLVVLTRAPSRVVLSPHPKKA